MSEADFVAHCAAELEALIAREGADTIAAFIGEPVLGTGGIVPPPAGYWEAIQNVLKKHDILLIADEVVTGFGRLGTMFGSAHYGHRARHHHHRQGSDLGLCAAFGLDRLRQGLEGARAGHRRVRRRSATAGPIRPIRSARRRASPTSS